MRLFELLAYVGAASAASNLTEEEAANLERYWSYGRSDPVYPTPQGAGTGAWAHAYELARDLVSQMTNIEKSNLTHGFESDTTACSGKTGSVPRLGFPGLCFEDAGNGVRDQDFVNSYPSGLHVGAAWNRDLAYERGYFMGKEFREKGVDVMLGPVLGPLGRLALGGRNWEGFSSDPYLCGSLAHDTIEGAQENVVACAKHFVAYEQETARIVTTDDGPYNVSVSSNLDDKTMHELYLWPFQDAVQAGVGSIMCSYNKINGSYACENSKSLNGLAKGELDFQGFVMSDWGAGFAGVSAANSGLDVAMPYGQGTWENDTLVAAVNNGSLAQSRLDDMSTRIVAAWMFAGGSNRTEGVSHDFIHSHPVVEARDPSSKSLRFQGAVEGQVLVKNTGGLPLNKPKLLSVFGYDSVAQSIKGPAEDETGEGMGVQNVLSYPNGSSFHWGNLIFGSTKGIYAPEVALNGTLIVGGGSGSNTPAYIDAPLDALKRQAYEDDTYLSWDTVSGNPLVNADSDACLVFINTFAMEGLDRYSLADPYSDDLVNNVAANCSNTIVVIHNAGIRLVDRFYDNPNVTAIVYAHLPGSDSGRAITEILYGKQSPSGRLPYTVAHNESDYGNLLAPNFPTDDVIYHPQSNFTEGVYIDYKYFIKENITPRFPFGFGLTYTNFTYAGLKVNKVTTYTNETADDLFNIVATVSVEVTNSGKVSAAEVPQLYVGIPGGPEKVLRGYDKEEIAPGQTHQFTFDLTRRDLSTWDVVSQSWLLQSGEYNLYVGKDVLDIQLTGTLTF